MSEVEVQTDVQYGDAGGRPLKLDIYRPQSGQGDTAILLVHGGGWRGGSKDVLGPMSKALAREGFAVFTQEYRLTPEAPYPACIHDVKRAIRWVRANAATYNFDPKKLCLQGQSAGAHLVLLAAGTPNARDLDPPEADLSISAEAAAVAAFYPPTIMYRGATRVSGGTAATALKGSDASDELAAQASPISHVHKDYPPCMLLHGDKDTVVPISASRRFEEALRAAGGRCDLQMFAGLPHGFAANPMLRPSIVATLTAFYGRTVREPAKYAQPAPARTAAPARA
jgi:acetyl esterase/lipase